MKNEDQTPVLTTKATRMENEFGCRIYRDKVLILEGRVSKKEDIAPAFRDLLRTLSKCDAGAHADSARKRKYKAGNALISVKHIWHDMKEATKL